MTRKHYNAVIQHIERAHESEGAGKDVATVTDIYIELEHPRSRKDDCKVSSLKSIFIENENSVELKETTDYNTPGSAAEPVLPAEEGLSDSLSFEEFKQQIDCFAAEVPESDRDHFLRVVKLAAEVAKRGKTFEVTILKTEDRYHEARADYEQTRSVENAKALISAYQNLRLRQKELELPLEPRDELVAFAGSEARPSRAIAPTPSPGRARRGRRSLTARAEI